MKLVVCMLAAGVLLAVNAESMFRKWQGPDVELRNGTVSIFEDDFARCYVLRTRENNYTKGSSDTVAVGMSCIRRQQ